MAEGEFVRLLDKQDLANAAAILLMPALRSALSDLAEWAAQTGGWRRLAGGPQRTCFGGSDQPTLTADHSLLPAVSDVHAWLARFIEAGAAP